MGTHSKCLTEALLTSINNISFHAEICHGCSLEVPAQRKCRQTDRRTDWRTNRSKMTHIRTWPRSYPDKHSGQVWKFSVAKFSSYPSIKKVWTDRWTDRWLIYKHSILGYQKNIQVIAAPRKCGRMDRQTVWRTDDVITIFFNVGTLIIMHKKGVNPLPLRYVFFPCLSITTQIRILPCLSITTWTRIFPCLKINRIIFTFFLKTETLDVYRW